jgi:hypothetical protein
MFETGGQQTGRSELTEKISISSFCERVLRIKLMALWPVGPGEFRLNPLISVLSVLNAQ